MSLFGHWQAIRAELSGETAPPEALVSLELELTATHYTVRYGNQISDTGRAEQKSESEPARLELRGTAGPNAGRTIACIYQLKGDRLRICYGLDGRYPSEFATTARDSRYLVTYRRKAS